MQTTIYVLLCAIAFVQLPTCSFGTAQAKTAAVDSHSVVSKTGNSLTGTMIVSNCDKDSLSQSKAELSNQLTQKVQADTQNSNSKVTVNTVTQLSDGTLALDYECNDVADHETAKKTLNDACQHDDIKQTIAKSSKNDASSTVISKQQTTNQPTKTATKLVTQKATDAPTEKATSAKVTQKATDAPTEKATSAKATQKATDAPTEKATSAKVTQKATDAPTEKATSAKVTQKATDAPTEKATSAKVTQKATDAPTEKATSAKATQKATDAPTEKATSAKVTQKATDAPTEKATSAKVTQKATDAPTEKATSAKVTQKATDAPTEKATSAKVTQKATDAPTEKATSSKVTQKATDATTEKATSAKVTQKATDAPTEKATSAKVTQKSSESTTAGKPTQKPATSSSKSDKTLKPSKPSTIDCDKDHKVSVQDDHNLSGVLVVKSCQATRFTRKTSRCTNVGDKLGSLLNNHLTKAGINDKYNVKIVSTSGNKSQTEFHYTCPCEKARQEAVISSLKDACKEKDLSDTVTNENQPDDDDSSSESDEITTQATPPKVTQKVAESPKPTQKAGESTTAGKGTQKPATSSSKSDKTLKPSKPSTIDCDKDHKVSVQDDHNLSGVLVVKSCQATRFTRKTSRCTNVGDKLGSLLNNHLTKAGINDKYNVKIVSTSGNKSQTEFHYTCPCEKARQEAVISSLKDACKEKDLSDTVTNENQPDDDDSSSESDEATTQAAPSKVAQKTAESPKPTQKAAELTTAGKGTQKTAESTTAGKGTQKPTTSSRKSDKTLKPSKPSTIDCDKDHKVSVQDDHNLNGVLVVKSCQATRFTRKTSRCTNVGDKLGSLLNNHLTKAGINDKYNVKIVSTSGNKSQTEFHYTCPCEKARQEAVISSLKDACKEKDLSDTVTNENQPDDDDSSSESDEATTQAAPSKVTQKTAESPKPTQKAAESTSAGKGTQKTAESTTAGKGTQKPTTSSRKSDKTLKPSKPSTIDCDKDHKVSVQDDHNLNGVLVVKSCQATRFTRKTSRCTNVGDKLGSLLNNHLTKAGINDKYNVKIVSTSGNKSQTEFHYTCPCEKARQEAVISSLKDACKDKELPDTVTNENQPDDDDSSSESDENATKATSPRVTQKVAESKPTAKVTQTVAPQTKATAVPTAHTTQQKTTKAGGTKKPPVTKRTVQVKNCDDDDNIRTQDDETLTGKIVVQDCPCEKRFKNNETRLAAVSATVATQLRVYFQKLYNTKVNYQCVVKVLSGNKTNTVFTYTVKVPKADHPKVKTALQQACKDDEVKKSIEHGSIKRDGDEDSDSSSSEEDSTVTSKPPIAQKATAPPTEKSTSAKVTQKAGESTTAGKGTQKTATTSSKSDKTLKPSKPSTIDCDKDHKVSVQDDHNLSGVLVVKSCQATRFTRKTSRCTNVGDKLGSLLNNHLTKAGINDKYNVKIVSTSGNKSQTEFHYTCPCEKARQGAVISSLKDACKEKDLSDTVTNENQPDDDDSSSESDEATTQAAPSKVTQKTAESPKPTQKAAESTSAGKGTQKTGESTTAGKGTQKPTTSSRKSDKTLKPSKPSTIDCDKDHKVSVQDDHNLNGVLVVKSCQATRFTRKTSRCTNVGDKLGSLLNNHLTKAGINDKYNVKIVSTSGNKSQTEFHYTCPCEKARQGAVISSLKDACKEKDLSDTVTNENQPDDDDSSSESDEATTQAAPSKVTQKTAESPKPTQKAAESTSAGKGTQKTAESTTAGKGTQKPTTSSRKSDKTLKPSKPSTIDCDKDHKVSVQDDHNLSGVLVVKSCQATRFTRKTSRCTNVGDKLGSLLNNHLTKAGINDKYNVKIVSTSGNKSQTEFHYTCPCEKARQGAVISSLKDACKEKDLSDTVTNENQPDDDDSSSESDEATTQAAPSKVTQKTAESPKPTQKAAELTTAGKGTQKTAESTTAGKGTQKTATSSSKSDKTLKPSKPSTIDCDKDHKVSVQDDHNLSGVLVVKSCQATRFTRKTSRCTNVGDKLGSLLNNHLTKAGINDKYNVKIVSTSGNKSQTEFHYTCPCEKARQGAVISSLKDACKEKDLSDTVTNENQPDDDDSSSESDEATTQAAPSKVTQKTAESPKPTQKAAESPKPTQKAAELTTAGKGTQKTGESTTAAKGTQKPTTSSRKSDKTLKPSKPSTIDCDKDHKVSVQDDHNLSGVLVVKSCQATRFTRKTSRCTNVGDKLGSLLNNHLTKAGINDKYNVKIVSTSGNKSQTEFHYTCPCEKARQGAVISSLKDACKEKDLSDTVTNENQPDDDDSSSESDEATTQAAPSKVTQKTAESPKPTQKAAESPKPTQKAAELTTAGKGTQKTGESTTAAKGTQKPTTSSRKSDKTLKPSKPSTIDCDKDHKVSVQDDHNLSGVLVVKSCQATRFTRKTSRCTNVGDKLGSLLNNHLTKAGINDKYNVKIVSTSGNKSQTEFHYTCPCEKARQGAVISSLKDACKEKDLSDTVTNENQPDDDDSSSESDEATTQAAPSKVTQKTAESPKPTQKAAELTTAGKGTQKTAESTTAGKGTQKTATSSSKSDKTLKPSKPSTIDCDKDHKVSVQDDHNLNGVLVVKSCQATRFTRKTSRCTNVGDKLGSLLNNHLTKAGINDKYNVKIVSTSGNKSQTEFHYTCPCEKARQGAVISSLKDACKEKDLSDTVTKENQPDDDDSSSESDEATTQAAPSKVTQKTAESPKPTQKAAELTTAGKGTQKTAESTTAGKGTQKTATSSSKSDKTLKPSKPSTIDCDKDHKVSVQDDHNLNGVLVVKSCQATRFTRKTSRCTNVGDKLGSLLNNHLTKAGINDKYNVKIVSTSGNKSQTEFHYTCPCEKARQGAVISSLKDACKEKDLSDTVTNENQPDDDDSSSESDEATTQAAPSKVTQKTAESPKPTQKTAESPKPTQKAAESTSAGKGTQKTAESTTAGKGTQKPTTSSRKSDKTLKPSKPSTIDCDKDHKVSVQDDHNLNGVLVVKSCQATRFTRKTSRCTNVGDKLGSLLNSHLTKAGINDKYNVKIVSTSGNKSQTEFHYTCPCEKARQEAVISSLKDACKDKDLSYTVTNENQPDADDSSSESDETTTKAVPVKVTQKEGVSAGTPKETQGMKATAGNTVASHSSIKGTQTSEKSLLFI